MKKRNLIIFITGIAVLVLGAGMLGKNNIKAENKVAFKDKTTQEKILYRVTKETKKDKGDIYDEASEIIADEKGDNKKDVQKELEDHQKKMDKLAQKQMKDKFGGMVSFTFKSKAKEDAIKFLEKLQIFTLAESLGGVESLANHPALMTHASIPADKRAEIGITDDMVRLSVGVEDIEDLLADVQQSLEG